jgi:hypothetical protein
VFLILNFTFFLFLKNLRKFFIAYIGSVACVALQRKVDKLIPVCQPEHIVFWGLGSVEFHPKFFSLAEKQR